MSSNIKPPSHPLQSPFFLVWLTFTLLILSAILVIQPGWGFMDDHTSLRIAQGFWSSPSINRVGSLIIGDTGLGRFRPINTLWIISAYKIGENAPLLLYFFITLAGLLLLPLWGIIADNVFNGGRRDPFWIWFFPLTFFLFTPFWNAFMYISIQEKFVYFFSAPAIFFFLKAYEHNHLNKLVPAFLFSALAVAGKETGASLFMAFTAYAVTNLVLFRRTIKISLIATLINSVAFIAYYFFIRGIMKNYTAAYADGMTISKILSALAGSPLYIKCILIAAVLVIAMAAIRRATGRPLTNSGHTLFAWLALFYIAIMLPWGFSTFRLAPLAVFIAFIAAPLLKVGDKLFPWRMLKNTLLALLIFLTAWNIIIPCIQKMADKRAVVTAIRDVMARTPDASFFYPAPFSETADALRAFSGANIIYLSDNSLSADSLTKRTNFLLANDESSPVTLCGVATGRTVYESSTWWIYPLVKNARTTTSFKESQQQNVFQRFKDKLKAL